METLIVLLIIAVAFGVAMWVIKFIPFPPELSMVRTLLIIIAAVIALVKILEVV